MGTVSYSPFVFTTFCIIIIIHTDSTKGAVRVVIPNLIPANCNTTDSKTEHKAQLDDSQLEELCLKVDIKE